MTAAERERLRVAVSQARRASIRFTQGVGAQSPALRRLPTGTQPPELRARKAALRERHRILVEDLDVGEWE